ncbi:murein biosynthesis integral membrane protein MurJ [Oceanivirga salmonicida]|uniref:murein biosynthesis integral membrane protein MurJ n=1 Tax=Oceanivirga salmonicida TaxID=1769291 RepID=UPI0012E0CB1E|nr:murein biosynthesis integral membrane protein MurJ [Oceanivirga salmonicida]
MFKSGILVMIINMISRLLGLLREVLMATFFGSNAYTDAYFASSRISNFFTTLLSDGSMGTVLIPLYAEKKEKEGVQKANEFVHTIMTLLFNFSVIVALTTMIFSKSILLYLIGFKDPQRLEIANSMLKVMSFYVVFISLSGIVAAYLNSYKKFFISALVGVAFNFTLITGLIISKRTIGIYGLSITFLISGFIQLGIQLPTFFKIIKKVKFNFNYKDEYVKSFFKLMIPTLIGLFAYQVNEIVNTNFASHLKIGTISAINYASRLYLLPIGVFAISLSTVIYPHLVEAIVKKDSQKTERMFVRGVNLLAFLIIPCVFGLFFYSREIVSLLFAYGKFKAQNVIMTSEILKCYALGLVFFSTNHILARVHYANKNRVLPVIASFIAIGINITLAYILYQKYAHIGLTTATVISASINYLILFVSIKKQYIDFKVIKHITFLLKVIIASAICIYISNNFSNIILKILVFMIIYAIIWVYPYYKNRLEMFD